MSNALTFEQSASILNAVASQATGTAQITPLNTAQFVSLAQTTLKTGYDNVIGAISQVLSRTIFGIRPYTRKLADYLKNYSERTQFVVITHRRGTMEAADRIYGVTMHEKGISDVLSIDVSEIEAKTGEKPV